MNKKTIRQLSIGLAAIMIAVSACSSETSSQPSANTAQTDNSGSTEPSETVEDMSVIPEDLDAEIAKAMERQSQDNVFVLDVRTDEEWNESHATGAVHWGLEEHLKQDELPDIDKDAEIYVYCRTGNRSGQAIKIMQTAGYTNLVNIGGLDDWVAADGATTSGIDDDDQQTTTDNSLKLPG